MGRESEGRGVCLAYVGIACCLKGGLLFSFREGPQGLEPHALPGAARPSGCNGRERESEREKYGRIPQGYLLSSKLRLSIQAGNGLETVGLWLGRWSSRAAGHLGLRE